MSIHKLIIAVLFASGFSVAFAESPPMHSGAATNAEEMASRCAANPEKCTQMKERMAQHRQQREEIMAACRKEPDRCEEIRHEHREQMMQKRCAENPERCEKMKARREEMRQKCAADPKACAERKAQFREKMEDRREHRMKSRESMPNESSAGTR